MVCQVRFALNREELEEAVKQLWKRRKVEEHWKNHVLKKAAVLYMV